MCLFLVFSQFYSFSCLLSLFLSSFFFLSSLFFPLFSLFTSRHGGQLRGIWMWPGARQVHSNSSLLLSLPPLLKKKKRDLFIAGIFPARDFLLQFINSEKIAAAWNYRYYSFILIQKKFKLQRVKSVIIFGRMVLVRSGLVAVDTAVGAIVVSDLSFGAGRPALCV